MFAGDELTVTAHIESARTMAGNDILTIRSEAVDAGGAPVFTAWSTLVARAAGGRVVASQVEVGRRSGGRRAASPDVHAEARRSREVRRCVRRLQRHPLERAGGDGGRAYPTSSRTAC